MGFPGGIPGKESACKAGDPGSIPGSRRSPEGNGYPLQHSYMEKSMDRGAWQGSYSLWGCRVERDWPTNERIQVAQCQESACQWRRRRGRRRCRFDPWVGKIPLRGKWQPTSVFLAWKISGTEGPGGLQSTGSQRVGYDWAWAWTWVTNTFTYISQISKLFVQVYFHWKKKKKKSKKQHSCGLSNEIIHSIIQNLTYINRHTDTYIFPRMLTPILCEKSNLLVYFNGRTFFFPSLCPFLSSSSMPLFCSII